MIKFLKEHKSLCFWSSCVLIFIGTCLIGIYSEYAMNAKSQSKKTYLFIVSGLSFFIVAFLAVKLYKRMKNPITCNGAVFALFAALQGNIASEMCMNADFFKGYIPYNLLGYFLYAFVFLIGVIIFSNPKIWFCVWEFFFGFYSIAQYYIQKFRGSPIKFTDLSNIRSALEIKSEYKLVFSFVVFITMLQVIGMIFLTIKIDFKGMKIKTRLITLGVTVACTVLFLLSVRPTYDFGIKNRIISLNFSDAEDAMTSRSVGSLLMFCYDAAFNHVHIPDNYSTEKVESMIDEEQSEVKNKTPIIIAVLNESFSDFSHIAPFNTNKEYIPNFRNLKENIVKGYVTVSSYGGYTCNSEYEFLSGNTMEFLPLGSAVYTNYMKDKQDSIVSTLNDMNFETISLTPCGRSLWNIGDAYEKLGFSTMYFGDNLTLHSKETYNGHGSDEAIFKEVEQLCEKRDKDRGLFFWVTTMQNHAPYCSYVPGGIKLTDIDDISVERYLNSIYHSDEALGNMMDYFKDYDEEVIIVMFGDHYPHIPSFAETLYGKPLADLDVENYSRIHQTPFVIWNNKGLESKEINDISLGYLGNEVMKAADLPLSPVQKKLEEIREKIPVVSGFGYKCEDGNWHATGETDNEYSEYLKEYESLQYYRMFDKNRKFLN